jgi:hypothetical protein
MPRIRRISSERGEHLEGHRPTKAAEKGSLESDAGTVLVDGAGAVHEFGDGLAAGEAFECRPEKDVPADYHQVGDDIERRPAVYILINGSDKSHLQLVDHVTKNNPGDDGVDEVIKQALAGAIGI